MSRERFKGVLKRKWGVRVHVVSSGFRRFGVGEAVAPDVRERLEVATVGGFQRGEVGGATSFGLRGEFHAGQIEAAEKFEQEDADGASVEIAEGMDREKAAFGECEQFEQQV